MTHEELQTLASLLRIDQRVLTAASLVLVEGQQVADAARAHGADAALLQQAIASIVDAELQVRATFVCHSPGCWEVVVGHNDSHRAPGLISLDIDDEVRLICARVGVMVPVRVTRLPGTPRGYYRGVVLDLEHSSMRYRRGDGVMFSDDQAVLPAGSRRSRRPIPV